MYTHLKGVFGGSGRDLMGTMEVGKEIIRLTNKEPTQIIVLYLGTASYDALSPKTAQTAYLASCGCEITSLDLVFPPLPSHEDICSLIERADVIMVSGGNTLYALDSWSKLGVDVRLREAIQRGAVMCGGSAGLICWFEGGHSDSMDPTTFKNPATPTSWQYIRVQGMGFLPGLVCPHHDQVQSNGILRSEDFDKMLVRHSGEVGIGFDHWAFIVIEGGNFKQFSQRANAGIWLKKVDEDGILHATSLPVTGRLVDCFSPAQFIQKDPLVDVCRSQNPVPF
eukprot:TRINITY_DN5372_c0_g1_i2.p1 TRINITY_DN5372_c0_g1~~TRINITY_DN5372_c0_g1_i2.p1  ORF type:complete len:281 (-),score=44.08 TRINITY_DN5372_c0_g1_i2:149-991(-)